MIKIINNFIESPDKFEIKDQEIKQKSKWLKLKAKKTAMIDYIV